MGQVVFCLPALRVSVRSDGAVSEFERIALSCTALCESRVVMQVVQQSAGSAISQITSSGGENRVPDHGN